MPCSCSVPGCKGNYTNTGPKVSAFKFPKDEFLRKRWIVAIRRKDFTVTKYSSVCELHFKKDDIETEASAYDPKTGRTLTAPLSVKRLKKGVIPSLRLPSLNSENSAGKREDPEKKRKRLENEQLNLAVCESLKSVSSETSQPEDGTQSSASRLTDDNIEENPHKKLTKRRKKSGVLISNKKTNGICVSDSVEECQSSYVQEMSQSLYEHANSEQHFKIFGQISSSSNSEINENSRNGQVQIKEEPPWEEEYRFQEHTSKKNLEGKRNDTNNVVTDERISEGCDIAFYKKPFKIDNRDEAFARLVACEMSDLRENPELYLKTQQSILKLLVEAHFEQMSSA